MPQRNYQILSTNADLYEHSGTNSVTNNGSLWFTYNSVNNYPKYHYLRFINIDVAQGSTINSAKLTFTGFQPQWSTPVEMDIWAELADNGTVPSTTNSFISNLVKTTATVAFDPATIWSESIEYDSPDIATIIQELVSRTGWGKGNAINFLIEVDNTTGVSSQNRAYSFDRGASKALKLEIDFTPPASGGITQITQPKTKQYFHKIYDKDGTYKATWGKDVIISPNFKWKINGGMGEQQILLKRNVKSFGENVDVKMGNKIETWIQDGDQEIGRLVWTGVLNRYEPKIIANGDQVIDVRGISKLIEYEKHIYQTDAGLTTDTKASKSPDTILREVITSKYGASLFQEGDIEATGTTVTFTFTSNTYRQVLESILNISPQYWYWRLLPDNTIDFKKANFDEIDHMLYVGKEANNVVMTKSIETLINKVYFMGGGDPNMYRVYERTSSQEEFGLREKFVKDERVTVVATAETIATRILDDFDHPLSQIAITVLDSNIDPKNGYDIERFKPGQIIQILHPEKSFGYTLCDEADWDVDYWDFSITQSFGVPHQIIEIDYQFNRVILKVSAKLEDTNKRIEDINRNLNETAKITIPVNPT